MSNGCKKGPHSPIQWALSPSVGFFGTQWMSSTLATSADERVCTLRIICIGHAWCPTSVLPLLKAMHHICLFSWHYTYSVHHHQLAVDFHTSQFKVCHDSGRLFIFNLTYLRYPPIAVLWHNLHVPITCLNLQSHDTISCQTCCYLIIWNFLVYLSEVENSKYGTWNTSTTGMNYDMPLILNKNHAVGVNW